MVKIPSGDCPASFTGPDVTTLATPSAGSSYVWTAKEAGTVWVACPVGDHCSEGGQTIKITVA